MKINKIKSKIIEWIIDAMQDDLRSEFEDWHGEYFDVFDYQDELQAIGETIIEYSCIRSDLDNLTGRLDEAESNYEDFESSNYDLESSIGSLDDKIGELEEQISDLS